VNAETMQPEAMGNPAQAVYSAKVIEEAAHPRNVGRMPNADAYGIHRGGCGDTMEIYLKLDKNGIQRAMFMTSGRTPAIAAGNVLTTLVQGLSVEEVSRISASDLIETLGGLPDANAHCAELMVNALREAIANGRERGHPVKHTWAGEAASVQR
jgi:nitrogen fixation NifU-like protein